MNQDTRRLRNTQVAAAVLFLLAAPAFFLTKCVVSPEISFITQKADSPWIRYPVPATTMGSVLPLGSAPPARFEKSFHLQSAPRRAELSVQAMREFVLYVNDREVAVEAERSWKRPSAVDVSSFLQTGENRLRIDVRNATGPQLLRVSSAGLPQPLRSDETWWVAVESAPARRAALATDVATLEDAFVLPSPLRSLISRGGLLLVVFLCCSALSQAGRVWTEKRFRAVLPWIVLAGVAVFWLLPLRIRAGQLPLDAGFDAGGHLAYVIFILTKGALPLATDGVSMYHPPLFYLVAAGLVKAFEGTAASAQEALGHARLIPLLCGLAHVGVAAAVARAIFPERPLRIALTTLMAGLIPMNIYVSTFISNESPFAFLAGATILGTVYILVAERAKTWMFAAAGLLLGLALLTKFTGLLLVPAVCFAVLIKLIFVEGRSVGRALAMTLLLIAGASIVSGWYYGRNYVEFDRFLVGNWNLPGAFILQWPGFRTPDYFLGIGESLQRPYFAGFHSFWDGMHSTFWGDGYCSGRPGVTGRMPTWNHAYMSATYLLAVPAVVMGWVGLIRSTRMAFEDEDLRVRVAMTLLLAATASMGCAMIYYGLASPIYSTAKAFFGLMLLGPLGLFMAVGFETIDRLVRLPALRVLRAVLYGWLGTLAAAVCLSYVG
jgi:hypothetical protein